MPRIRCVFTVSWLNSVAGVVGVAAWLLMLTGCAIPVLNASASGDTHELTLLLQTGHHANEKFPLIGTRPLMVAAANGHLDTVKALLDAGADANAEDWSGWTALHAAALNGDPSIATLLLTRGAIPSPSRWFLRSPASIAETLDHKDITPLLKNAAPFATEPPSRYEPHQPSQ